MDNRKIEQGSECVCQLVRPLRLPLLARGQRGDGSLLDSVSRRRGLDPKALVLYPIPLEAYSLYLYQLDPWGPFFGRVHMRKFIRGMSCLPRCSSYTGI